jgi:hypothetical protein
MREHLNRYGFTARQVTIVPWALEEPADPLPVPPAERSSVFGDADIGLMYSGSYGRAHTSPDLLALSRALSQTDAMLAFSVRGNRVAALKNAITDADSNVLFVPFATPDKLQERLFGSRRSCRQFA